MSAERREQVIHVRMESTGNRRNSESWRKAAAFFGWHEPDESRGSRPDLWAARGEIPRADPARKNWTQKIDTREVAALGIQLAAFNLLAELGGWKAPKLMIKPEDLDPEGLDSFQVIDVSAIPQHGGRPTD